MHVNSDDMFVSVTVTSFEVLGHQVQEQIDEQHQKKTKNDNVKCMLTVMIVSVTATSFEVLGLVGRGEADQVELRHGHV